MSLLITGASGFVGKNLIGYFQENSSFTTIELSLRAELPEHLPNAVAIIHLAGKAHDLKNTSEESEYFEVNYELTKKLFDRFLMDENSKTFIYISSVKAVADEVKGELTEDDIPYPITAYGRSKLKAENYILNNLPKNRRVVILRPCMIHGPGNKGNLNLLYSIVNKGIPWPLGRFDNQRSFLSIDNFNFVIGEILSGKLKTGVYNIADDEPLSTSGIIKIIADVNGKNPKIWHVPKSIINLIAKAGNVLPLPLNEERLQKLTENYLVSNKKIVSEMGKALPVSAIDGMRKTIQSFKK